MAIDDRPNRPRVIRRWESPSHAWLLPDSLVMPLDEQLPGRIFVPIDDSGRGSGSGWNRNDPRR